MNYETADNIIDNGYQQIFDTNHLQVATNTTFEKSRDYTIFNFFQTCLKATTFSIQFC